MARSTATEILDLEREFQLHELFFSTTDSKGILLHGNDVFTRISGYEESELIGSPHSIIRHPDMPRAVFHLLWETIQAGKTIAAYVKNLAKDGRYYWVLAVVMPCKGGYLSIRLKPTAPIFQAAQKIYAHLRQLERTIEIEPKKRPQAIAASRQELDKLLGDHGFKSYEDFMLHAISNEMASRYALVGHVESANRMEGDASLLQVYAHCQALDAKLRVAYEQLEAFKAMNVALVEKSVNILAMSESIRTLSMNATIAASKMGTRGATLQVVSQSLGAISDDSQLVTEELAMKMREVVRVLDRLIFDLAATKLQSEISLHFVAELLHQKVETIDPGASDSLKILFEEMNQRIGQVFDHLKDSEERMASLQSQIIRLAKNNKTLRFVQFAGGKESVGFGESEGFAKLFQEVKDQIDSTKRECDFLGNSLREVFREIRGMRSQREVFTPHLTFLHAFQNSLASVPSLAE